MSKIAIILSAYNLGSRPLDFWFNNIFESSRGATGTDISFCMISKELVKLGHDVHMFTVHAQPENKPDTWEGAKLYNFIDRHTVIDDTFDVVISISDPDALRGVSTKPLRIVWQFLNDWTYCQPGFDDFVDLYLGVCDQHTKHLQKQSPKPEKWKTLALGCDTTWFDMDKKVKGRMIFCSSADRGLHLALQCFPEIKKAVPEATLKIFYHFQDGPILNVEPTSKVDHPHVIEMANRLRYCKEAIKRMSHMGVEHIGSVSVNEIKKQMSEAEVLLFPVDTVAFSEGFSLSILQSHAAGAIPVITSADCIGGIYKNSGSLMVEMPIIDKMEEYTNLAIKALTDEKFAANRRKKCLNFAKKFLWKDIAKKMEIIINKSKK